MKVGVIGIWEVWNLAEGAHDPGNRLPRRVGLFTFVIVIICSCCYFLAVALPHPWSHEAGCP